LTIEAQRRHRAAYQAVKYEDLYRHEIGHGLALAERVTGYLTVYNTICPLEAIGFGIPLARYLQAHPPRQGPTFTRPDLSQILDTGHEELGPPADRLDRQHAAATCTQRVPTPGGRPRARQRAWSPTRPLVVEVGRLELLYVGRLASRT
jgi:hypothetical protein